MNFIKIIQKASLSIFLFASFPIFASAASVEITYPQGGQTFNAGNTINIQWEPMDIKNLTLEYVYAQGNTVGNIVYDLSGASTSYQWVIPSHVNGAIKIRYIAYYQRPDGTFNTFSGESNVFHVVYDASIKVTKPSIGEKITAGSKYLIMYNLTTAYPQESLLYSFELYKAGIFYKKIDYASQSLSHEWQVPLDTPAGDDYQIKVFDNSKGVSALSDVFTVISNYQPDKKYDVHFLQPTAGSNLKFDGTYTASWDSDCSGGFMSLWLALNSKYESSGEFILHPLSTINNSLYGFTFNQLANHNTGSATFTLPRTAGYTVEYSYNPNNLPFTRDIYWFTANNKGSVTMLAFGANGSVIDLGDSHDYRLYVNISGKNKVTGQACRVEKFSDFFSITNTGSSVSTPAPVTPLTYLFSDIKPGWLAKNKKFAEVFYVESDMKLRWIINEAVAIKHFGPDWNKKIIEFDDLGASGLIFGPDVKLTDSLSNNVEQPVSGSTSVYSLADIKPGWLVKNKKFAEVFYVESDMKLRWIINETVAEKHFGKNWNQIIKEFYDLNASGLQYGSRLE